MSSVLYPALGSATVVRQPGYELRSDPDGLASTTETFRGYFSDMTTAVGLRTTTGYAFSRAYLAPHFLYPSLRAYAVRITNKPGVLDGLLAIEYRGLDPLLSYPPPPIYSTEESSGAEPIQNHPLFSTPQMAGTAASPANGAIFTDAAGNTMPAKAGSSASTFDAATAVFTAWAASSPFNGMLDYEAPCIVFRATFTSYGLPDLSYAGTFSEPDGPAPGPPEGQDWWFVGGNAEDNAGIYRCTLTWKTKVSDDGPRVIYGG